MSPNFKLVLMYLPYICSLYMLTVKYLQINKLKFSRQFVVSNYYKIPISSDSFLICGAVVLNKGPLVYSYLVVVM